ncbi:DMT family transporter [Myxococcota bacterium]|nr:DMT family transporter [Myxococcota bacterium]
MELWVPITIAAAFSQNIRAALQKVLKDRLSDAGATFVRFGFGLPVAIVYLLVLKSWMGSDLPDPSSAFVAFGLLGGTTQIVATFLLVRLFSLRNFAVGTAYSKTEPIQAAFFGIVLLGETPQLAAALAIAISTVGVGAISVARSEFSPTGLFSSLVSPPALIGLASGALFGVSAVAYRAASLALGGPGFMMQAAFTLTCVILYQTLAMVLYLAWFEPGQLTAVLRNWRPSAWVGLVGVVGSACWFTAMTIQNAAYVRALGQVELFFTAMVSWFYFRERLNRIEIAGIALIAFGIVLLLIET